MPEILRPSFRQTAERMLEAVDIEHFDPHTHDWDDIAPHIARLEAQKYGDRSQGPDALRSIVESDTGALTLMKFNGGAVVGYVLASEAEDGRFGRYPASMVRQLVVDKLYGDYGLEQKAVLGLAVNLHSRGYLYLDGEFPFGPHPCGGVQADGQNLVRLDLRKVNASLSHPV